MNLWPEHAQQELQQAVVVLADPAHPPATPPQLALGAVPGAGDGGVAQGLGGSALPPR